MATTGSDTSPPDPIRPDFGPYKIVRRLGVGGMAETFEAIRTGPGGFTQRVCLKVVLPFFRNRQDFRELFEREARLAAKLRHSNVVGVIDFGQIDGVTYIALELVDGVDLASLLDAQASRRLSHEHVAVLGHGLAAALEHAHDPRRAGSDGGPEDNAIIHRDLSPSNVLVSQNGEVLLTDFGVAKAITGTARQQSAVKGKVPYMSPEQLRAEPVDGRSDLFGLGVVLFEALSGHRPFQGEHDPATIMKILHGERPSLREVAPTAPPALCDAIESLLAIDRNDRPKDARAVLELLDPFVPPPRVRRELGEMASEARALQPTRTSQPPIDGSDATDLPQARPGESSGVGRTSGPLAPDVQAAGQTSQQRRSPTRSTRKRLAWALLALVAAFFVFALWRNFGGKQPLGDDTPKAPPARTEAAPTSPAEATPTNPTEPEPAAPERATPKASAPSEPAPVEPPTDSPAQSAPPKQSRSAVPAVEPARLTVVVFPWGDVWINGKRRGTAPLKDLSLKPGRYKISAGRGKPSKTQTVRLREAQRKTVQFELTE